MNIDNATLVRLKVGARQAASRAYAPYSKFAVGAAVLTADGEIFTACNVENASYGLSVCAERSAIFGAVASGARKLAAIVVYTATPQPTTPCGACRQVAHEFGPGAVVICCTDDAGAERRYSLDDLLPQAFGADRL